MIYTSYFAKIKNLPKNVIPISISLRPPNGYKGKEYKKLAPDNKTLVKYKEDSNSYFYTLRYKFETLNKLNIFSVLDDLFELIPKELQNILKLTNCPWWENDEIHICLVCYEKPEDFCHRHLDANWFNENGIRVEEYNYIKEKK